MDNSSTAPELHYELREARKTDLEQIANIHFEAFEEEPMDNYCYPDRANHKEEHLKWLRKEYEHYIDNGNKYSVCVAEPKPPGSVEKPVMAYAVWTTDVLADAPAPDRGLDQRNDVNKKHMEAYTRVAGQRYKPGGLFAEWGRQQYTLSVLAVLPGFRRKGVGTALVNWGVREVSGNGWPVTVCASPMGRYLYEHLGFVDIGTEVIRAEDEENSFSSKAMALQPESSGRVSGNVPTQSTKA